MKNRLFSNFFIPILVLIITVIFNSCGDGAERLYDDPELKAGEILLTNIEKDTETGSRDDVKQESLEIELIPCVRPGDEIRFKFNMPMVKENALRSGDIPAITFHPDLSGKFEWRSPTELVFTPQKGVVKKGQ